MPKIKKRIRDYKTEYKRRIALGEARKLSRSQARGHPKFKERYVSGKKFVGITDDKIQQSIRDLRSGKSLASAAKAVKVSPDRLRNYFKSRRVISKKGSRWIVRKKLPRQVAIYSGGKELTLVVGDFDTASLVGKYQNAVRKFLRTNNPRYLEPYAGKMVKDIAGNKHPLETRPNALYRLNASSTESFEQIYKIIV